jgi:hypothetical protein
MITLWVATEIGRRVWPFHRLVAAKLWAMSSSDPRPDAAMDRATPA